MITHTQNEIHRKWAREDAKTFESFFLETIFLCQNYETLEFPTRTVFHPLIWNLAVLQLNNWSLQPRQRFLKF